VKRQSRKLVSKRAIQRGAVDEEARTCPVCGTKFFATAGSDFCPVCILRGATGEESAATREPSSVSGSADSPRETEGASQARRFDQYEVFLDEDGRPIELGRGAMGITYKAFDVDLRYPVTLKVISERYLGDESAQLRFVREARAAASVRHPSIASVFHLGRSGENYFYAMEFVEGETLESLIERSGRLEAKLALEIVTQVATGLAAVHKRGLVHRDIKPSNIMVGLRHTSQIISGRWNPFSQPLSAAAMPVCFGRRCMRFIFREFSGAMPPLRLIFSEPEERCSWF
jgi:uncharacterized Zn finger protein (UPF0148 family)